MTQTIPKQEADYMVEQSTILADLAMNYVNEKARLPLSRTEFAKLDKRYQRKIKISSDHPNALKIFALFVTVYQNK